MRKSGCSSVVERNLAKVDVVGSSPIIRSLSPTDHQRSGFFSFFLVDIPVRYFYNYYKPVSHGYVLI